MIAAGRISAAGGAFVRARLPVAAVGDTVRIGASNRGEIVAVRDGTAVIAPFANAHDVRCGDAVVADAAAYPATGMRLLGRAVDALGAPLDEREAAPPSRIRPCLAAPPPGEREAIREPLWTGVRAIDGLLTVGRGARVGLFGSPGLGKSTLLEMLADGCDADAVVVALVGERGREAQHWIARRNDRTTIVCATGDRSAAERARAARFAMTHACELRRRGLHVLLVMDSLMRFANALREMGVASGESVGRAGFPASVFSELARFTECAGATSTGSVTLVATVLNDGDERDPVSEAARALLDGHIELSPRLAHAGHFPAIDVLASASRTMNDVVTPEHRRDARAVRGALTALSSCAEARAVGLLPADPAALRALQAEDALERFLRQGCERSEPDATLANLAMLADSVKEDRWTLPPTSPP